MLAAAWQTLRVTAPAPALARLAQGGVGKQHLADTAGLLLASAPGLGLDRTREGAAPLACDLLLAAWEDDPLDGDLAGHLLAAQARRPFLPAALLPALDLARARHRRPENLTYFLRLAARREYAKLTRLIAAEARKDPDNLFWPQRALVHAAVTGDWDFALETTAALPPALAFAHDAARAQASFLAGDWPGAARRWAAAHAAAPLPGLLERQAEAVHRSGDTAGGRGLWRQALAARPWQANLLLRVHDALTGRDRAAAQPPGRTAVLLYCFNKARDLDATLASLAASDLGSPGEARIFVLDNGSTDSTPEVIAAWAGRLGGRLSPVHLPVNVGAPAARNWLASLPEVRDTDFCAYLDDDVEVPADWLARLGAAAAALPGAGAWGCRIREHGAPGVLQNADLHLQPPDGKADYPDLDPRKTREPCFRVSNLHLQTLDLGQFDYLRPCASVTGCCHLFRTATLRDAGGFSIRLSPTQYDDLEHDLRLAAAGRFAAYQGHLCVAHKKKTGKVSQSEPAPYGNAIGNQYKLQAMHPAAEIRRLAAEETAMLLDDLEAKARAVDAELFGREIA
ncbi:MAG: glycosyltransferase [Thermodesulfobacteriota bacterium]